MNNRTECSVSASLEGLRTALRKASDDAYAKVAARFFKTGKGEYGEGDIFIGVRVPAIREIVKGFHSLSSDDTIELLTSPIHEERMSGAMILVHRYKGRKTAPEERTRIYDFYMTHAQYFNNWDLVDLTAPAIPGEYLIDRDRKILREFAGSDNMWKRRISIVTTHAFIKKSDCTSTYEIAGMLLGDKCDLIHKAVGWMLREAGKIDMTAEEVFLKKHLNDIPRTALRYAIEKFPESKRKRYLQGSI